MQLTICGQDIEVAPDLRHYIEHRMGHMLNRLQPRIGQVMIWLADLNGPRGGVDKRCRIVANVAPFGSVAAEATNTNPQTAIDRAARRIAKVVAHDVDRRRSRTHRAPRLRQDHHTHLSRFAGKRPV